MKPGRLEGSGATDRHGPDSRGTGGRSVHGQAWREGRHVVNVRANVLRGFGR